MEKGADELEESPSSLRVETGKEGGGSELNVRDDESRSQSSVLVDGSVMKGEDDDEKQRKKRGKEDEVFTDKDRAAAVVIGTRDIKAFLEHKKFVDQKRRHPEDHNAHLFFDQARFLMNQAKWEPALQLINKALDLQADNTRWLTERARCHANLSQLEDALTDVEEVLKIECDYFPAIYQKAEILYSLWDLEHSLLYFHRGLQIRPGNANCLQGARKARMALESELTAKVAAPKQKHQRSKKKKRKSVASKSCCMGSIRKSWLQLCASSSSSSQINMHLSKARNSSTPSTKNVSGKDEKERRFSNPSELANSGYASSGTKKPKTKPKCRKGLKRQKNGGKSKKTKNVRLQGKSIPSENSERSHSISSSLNSSISGLSKCRSKLTAFDSGNADDCNGSSTRSSSISPLNLKQQLSDSVGQLRKKQSENSSCAENKTISSNRRLRPRSKPKKRENGSKTLSREETFSLTADEKFLESVLNNKELRQGKSQSVKKAFGLMAEVYNFVTERKKYWSRNCKNSNVLSKE